MTNFRQSSTFTKGSAKRQRSENNPSEQMELKMRAFANYLIDRVLVIQENATKKGLNINKESSIYIMEHEVL